MKNYFSNKIRIVRISCYIVELTNASITCQNIINDTLRDYLDIIVVIYLNDILVFSNTLKKYQEHV